MPERYNPKNVLTGDTDGAKVKYFTPEQNRRDRFGNRMLISKDLAYLDRSNDKVKAGILISPEGEKFIKQNPGIIKKIDSALSFFETHGKYREEIVDLDDGVTIEIGKGGNQSEFYILTAGGERYAIKTNALFWVHQPYINEMLQSQSLATDLKDALSELKVRMSTFLFASGQVFCTRYEENVKNYDEETEERLERVDRLELAVSAYVVRKKSEHDPLWENIEVDIPYTNFQRQETIRRNFMLQPDGVMVWIDPFFYNET